MTAFPVLLRSWRRTSQVGLLALILLVCVPLARAADAQEDSSDSDAPSPIVVDSFEGYATGSFTDKWVFVKRSGDVVPASKAMEPGEEVVVKSENGNQFVRYTIRDEALRLTQRNGKEFDWSLDSHPILSWRWRAVQLPEGASERGKNDTGGAVYVTFGTDWLGRPKSIKYTYSSTLPVGTVVEFGPLYVIVASSGREPGTGTWKTVRRRIADDYRQVFGGKPPNRPLSITLWSDSDTTSDVAIVDFDDVRLLPGRSASRGADSRSADGSR